MIAYGGVTLDQLHLVGITGEAASCIMQNRAITVSGAVEQSTSKVHRLQYYSSVLVSSIITSLQLELLLYEEPLESV